MSPGMTAGFALTALCGVFTGFISAIPVGAVQVEVIRKSLRGHYRAALLTALGSASSDLLYGVLVLFGLSPLLLSPRFQVCFYFLGAAVLCLLLWRSLIDHSKLEGREKGAPRHRYAFMTGFTLAIANPSIVAWWILSFRLFLDLGLFETATPAVRLVFILSGAAGLGGYLTLLAAVIHRIHRNIPDAWFRRMNRALIAIYAALAVYFIWKAVDSVPGW